MLELRTLGTIDLRGDGARVESVLLHSKRIALLAYVCASDHARLHRRDTLVALLWPDLDEVHARGALRHELWELRRALGPGVLRGESAEAIGADTDRIWCDVRDFESSLDEGRPGDALALWHGEYLPGLHVSSGAFDRWLDDERNRLARRAADAARQLLTRADGGGDVAGAISWARRLTELAPFDETGWQRLMLLLDQAGDRAGALRECDRLAERLRTELDVEPSPETVALMERIRGRDRVFDTTGAIARRPARAASQGERAIIGVEPVENQTANPMLDPLARLLADRLAQGLAGLNFAEVAHSVGLRDLTAIVSTTMYARGAQIEVVPKLVRPGEERRLIDMPRSVLLSPDAPAGALDELVSHVMVAVAAHYDPRFDVTGHGGAVAIRMPRWGAYMAWLQGSDLFGQSRFAEALTYLRRALEIDPRFTKAGVMAAYALAASGDPAAAETLLTEVAAAGDPLSDYDRTTVEFIAATLHGRRADAYRAAVEGTTVATSPVAVYAAAREAAYLNRPHEAVHRLEAFELSVGWWRHLAEYYETICGAHHVLGDHDSELASALEGRARFPASLEVLRAEIRARAALGQADHALRLVDQALTLPAGLSSPADIGWVAAQELDVHGHGEAGARSRSMTLDWLSELTAPSRRERQLQVRLLFEEGQVDAASRALKQLAPLDEIDAQELAGLVAARAGDTTTARGIVHQLEALQHPYLCGRNLLAAAGIRAALDPPRTVVATLRRAFAQGLPFGVELHALPVLRPLVGRTDFSELLAPRG